MLEVGFLNVHLLWMTTFPEMEKIYDMITVNAARCINLKNFELKEGGAAHLVVLDATSVNEALWYQWYTRPESGGRENGSAIGWWNEGAAARSVTR